MKAVIAWLMSVRGRVTLGVTVLFAVVMVFGGWFLLNRAEAAWIDDLEAQDLTELEILAQDLAKLEVFTQSLEALGPVAGGQAFAISGIPLPVGVDGTVFDLVDEAGVLVASTPSRVFSGSTLVGGPVPLGDMTVEFFDPGPDLVTGPDLLAFSGGVGIGEVATVSLPVHLEQGTLTLTASSSLEPVQAGVNALRDILWVVVPLLVAGVGATTWFITGRAFRPVAAITGQVERISDDRLDERVPVPTSRDEIAHLARTMNTMLDRLGAGRRRQRQFVSDASHELRNPVATSKVKLEVALAHPETTDWEKTARVVLEEQERLGTLVDDLLLLARLDEGQPPGKRDVDLEEIVFTEAARPHPVDIDVSQVEAARVRGNGGQLTQLVRNLVDNAVRHAETRVGVSLATEGDCAVLAVQDDGPGIPEADRTRIFERFVRLEDARTRDQGGAGLGLALVHAVTSAHDGTVGVSAATSGGACFEVTIPQTESGIDSQ